MKPPKKLYQFHVANLREIDRAMNTIARALRAAISRRDAATESAFMRVYALLLGSWAECRLRKLLYEPISFDDSDRTKVRSQTTQMRQWEKTLEIAFRRQYGRRKGPLNEASIPHSAFTRYRTLTDLLSTDLVSIIELRNKLAHGQWVFPLNKDGDDVAQEQMDALRNENLLALQFKKALIESLSAAIHDVVVSKPTFERDFDAHFRTIVETRRNLRTRDYEAWAEGLRQKFNRGSIKRSGGIIA